METLPIQIKSLKATIAILTVPSSQAQPVTDVLVSAGIKAIWNFTNVKLKVPESVVVQKEDLTSGYAMLCVMMNASRDECSSTRGKHCLDD